PDAVMLTLPVAPSAGTAALVAESVYVHAPAPACVTVTGCPAIVSVPVRDAEPVFAAIELLTVPFPVPLAPAVIVIHAALLAAVHVQVVPDAVMLTLPVAPSAGTAALVAESVYVHAPAPACVTVTVCPAIVSVPVRDAEPVFAAIELLTVPFPVPLAPAVIVIHAALLVAVHVQLVPDAVMLTLPVAPSAATAALVAESVYV